MNLSRLFAPKPFLLALGLAVAGVVAGGAIPVIGAVARYGGLAVAGFALGVLSGSRRYVEAGLAGALAAGGGFLLSSLSSLPWLAAVSAETGVAVAGVGVSVGTLCTLAGHYFGRDLRAGLTQQIGTEETGQ